MNPKTSVRFAALSFMLTLGIAAVPALRAQPGDIAALKAQHKALDEELKRELGRLQDYLDLVDQMLSAQLMLGQVTPQQAGEQLQRIAATVYEQGYTDDAKWKLHQQQFAAVDGFVRHVQSQVAAATRWPSDRPAQEYLAAAEKEIVDLWTVFPRQMLMAVNLAPRLARIAELLAWTRGEASLPKEQNPFAQSRQRVLDVLSGQHARYVQALRSAAVTASRPTTPGSAPIGRPPSPPIPIETESHGGVARGSPGKGLGAGSIRRQDEVIHPAPGGLDPADFRQTIESALTAVREGRYADGLPLFERAVRANPNSDTALTGLGLCQNLLGDIDSALRTYETLYRVAPQSPGLGGWFAELLTAKGDYAAARRWIEQELQVNPNSAWALSWLGSIEWGAGREHAAREAFARAMESDPRISTARFENGTKIGIAQPGRAIVDFTAALLLNPKGSAVYYYLGECYLQVGQRHEAMESFRRFLEADPASEWSGRARQRLKELGASTSR